MTLGVPHVPFYDSEDELEKAAVDSELKAFRARQSDDDRRDFIETQDFELRRNIYKYADHWYKGRAEEYYAGKLKYEEEQEQEEERDDEEEWVELPSLFYDAGILFVFGKIDNEAANNIIGSIILLNDDPESIDQLVFYINSPGGFLKPGLAIFDIMHSCNSDLGLNTVGLGLVASTASLILSAGDPGSRLALEHTRVMMHQPTGQFRPKSEDLKVKDKKKKKEEKKLPKLPGSDSIYELTSYMDELLDLRRRIIDVYAFTTENDPDVISRDIERDFFMSAEDAQAYGIIDRVLTNPKDGSGTESDEEAPYKKDLDEEDLDNETLGKKYLDQEDLDKLDKKAGDELDKKAGDELDKKAGDELAKKAGDELAKELLYKQDETPPSKKKRRKKKKKKKKKGGGEK